MENKVLDIKENQIILELLNDTFWDAYHQSKFDFNHYYQDLIIQLMPYHNKAAQSTLDINDLKEMKLLLDRLEKSIENQMEGF